MASAPEDFQRRQHQEVENLTVVIAIEDMLVLGEGESDEKEILDHDEKVDALICKHVGSVT